MSPRHAQPVTIPTILDRRKGKTRRDKPWVVRYQVNGKRIERYFALREQAEYHKSGVVDAIRLGERFDPHSGEPVSWVQSKETCAAWAARWFRLEYGSSPGGTQQSIVEALEHAVPRLISPRAPSPPRYPLTGDRKKDEPTRCVREYIRNYLCNPDGGEPTDDLACHAQQWLTRWSLPLTDVDKVTAKRIHSELQLNLVDGKPSSAWVTKRRRFTIGALFASALELDLIPQSPWPSARVRKKQRASERVPEQLRPELIMTPEQFRDVLVHVPSHQPNSRRYMTFYAIMYLAGLRPHEVHPLNDQHLVLPEHGWGTILVRLGRRAASKRWQPDGPIDVKQTKTGNRDVPIPPQLVELLEDHIKEWGPGPLFRSAARSGSQGGVLTQSNINRVWTRAKTATFDERDPLLKSRVYDLRHANASNLLAAGMPLAETARRLGHSIETLVRIYAKSFPADIAAADQRLEERLANQG